MFYLKDKIQQGKKWIAEHPRLFLSYAMLLIAIVTISLIIFVFSKKHSQQISSNNVPASSAFTNTYPDVQASSAIAAATESSDNNTQEVAGNILKALGNSTEFEQNATALSVATTLAETFTKNSVNGAGAVVMLNSANAVNSIPNSKTITTTIRSKDTLPKIFKRLGLNSKEASKILVLNQTTKALYNLKAGQKINITIDKVSKKLLQLTYRVDFATTITITKKSTAAGDVYRAQLTHVEPKSQIELANATISRGSVIACAKKAGLTNKEATQAVSVFSEKINILRDARPGDKLSVLHKEYYVNGEKINDSGEVLAIEFIHKDKTYRAIAFTDPYGRTDYYTPEGNTLKSPFVRYPLKFRAIGSRFSLHRYHPILHIYCAHTGVDLDAPMNTPIKATSDGIISFVGVKTNYGKIIIIEHNQYSTFYAHLNGFAASTVRGHLVKQGQVIGYLGMTGRATGPHLHYEFRIHNTPVDPLTVKLPPFEMIAKSYKSRFLQQARPLLAKLDVFDQEEKRKLLAANGGNNVATASVNNASHNNAKVSSNVNNNISNAVSTVAPQKKKATSSSQLHKKKQSGHAKKKK